MTDIFGALRLKNRPPRRLQVTAPFPPLPIELVRYILELAAAADRPTALRLALVSNPVHAWVAPLLFRTVTLASSEHVLAFHAHLRARPAAAPHVRHLALRCLSVTAAWSLNRVLSACTRVERLLLDSLHRQPLDPALAWPAPWEVVFRYGAGSWVAHAHPVLRGATHLHLDAVLFQSTLEACMRICPRLTHVGISYNPTSNNAVSSGNFVRLVRWLLAAAPSLEMVLLQAVGAGGGGAPDFSDRFWGELADIEDPRLLVRAGLEYEEYYAMLRSGRSIWDDAWTKFGNWRSLARRA